MFTKEESFKITSICARNTECYKCPFYRHSDAGCNIQARDYHEYQANIIEKMIKSILEKEDK